MPVCLGQGHLEGDVVAHDPLELQHLLLHGDDLRLHLHSLLLLASSVPLLGLLILLLLALSPGATRS